MSPQNTPERQVATPTSVTSSIESNQCPECRGHLAVDEARGDTACTECGLVVEQDRVDTGPEWRTFDTGYRDERTRVGLPRTKLLHDEGLSTSIGWQDRDATGRMLTSRQRARTRRLRTWNERFRTKSARERNLKHALAEIDRMASALGVPKADRETASVIYRRALKDGLVQGRSIEGVATAALYAAVRMGTTPRSLDEVTSVSRVDRGEIARTYRYVLRELNLEIGPTDPAQFIPRLASALDISDETEHRACELLEAAKAKHLHSGKSPVGLAAAAVYAAGLLTNDHVTQADVGEVANISEVTIRHRYAELLEAQESSVTA